MPVITHDAPDLPEFIPWAGAMASLGAAWSGAGILAVVLAPSADGKGIGVCVIVVGFIQLGAAAIGWAADRILSRSAGETGPPEDHS